MKINENDLIEIKEKLVVQLPSYISVIKHDYYGVMHVNVYHI